MDLPRNPEILVMLLERIGRWLSGYEPLALTSREYLAILRAGSSDPARRPLLERPLRRLVNKLENELLSIEIEFDDFVPLLGEDEVQIYLGARTLDPQALPEGMTMLVWGEAWLAASEQMITAVKQLRNKIIAQLESSTISEQAASQAPANGEGPPEVPADLHVEAEASSASEQGRLSQPQLRARVDGENSMVILEDKVYAVSHEGAAFVQALDRAGGNWLTSAEIGDAEPVLMGSRLDRLLKRLPGPVHEMIQSKPGTGYRIRKE